MHQFQVSVTHLGEVIVHLAGLWCSNSVSKDLQQPGCQQSGGQGARVSLHIFLSSGARKHAGVLQICTVTEHASPLYNPVYRVQWTLVDTSQVRS